MGPGEWFGSLRSIRVRENGLVKTRSKIWLLLVVSIPALAVAAGGRYTRRARLFAPAFFGLERAAERLFVDPEMSPSQRQAVVVALGAARDQVASFWVEPTTVPIICACSTADCYHRFGGGRDRGQTTFGHILLSPRGLDAVVITHEWTHAELSRRSGGLFSRTPAWFSEGLAVVASVDPRYNEEAWNGETGGGRLAPALAELETLRQFLDSPRAYVTAGHEVRRWLLKVGRAGLLRLMNAIRTGEEFHHAYQRIEQQGLPSDEQLTRGARDIIPGVGQTY
jgi:hypothetical protein